MRHQLACVLLFLAMAHNGTKFLQKTADSNEFDILNDIEQYVSPLRIGAPKPYGNCSTRQKEKSEDFRELEKLSKMVEDLFFEAHSHIRDIDGFHADEALDELCKVLYAKMYDEENIHRENPIKCSVIATEAPRNALHRSEKFIVALMNMILEFLR